VARRSKVLSIPRGDYYPHTVRVEDDAGTPVDLSDWSDWASQVRASPAATGDPLATFEVDDSGAEDGRIVFFLD